MKISEFIEKLKTFQAEHGDLEVELSGEVGPVDTLDLRSCWFNGADYLEIGSD